MSSLALQLGWQDGYTITYTNTTSPLAGSAIIQTIAIYPEKSIPDVIALIGKQEQSDSDVTYTGIPSPGIGDISGGYTGKARAQMILKTDDSNPLAPGAVKTEPGQDIAEIWFSKGTVFEVIRMTGPGADTDAAISLARTAYAKLP
jgi:hypothetical protein